MRNIFRKSKVVKMMAMITVMSFTGGSVFANYPVLDISNLMNAIQQLYATYDQINTAIEQVQNTYQQLENQINSVKSMDWDDLANSFSSENWSQEGGLKGTWDNIGNFRNNLTNATSAINSNLNLINDVKHTLENKTVTCMGKQYTVAGLFGIGKYGQNNIMNLPASALDYVKNAGEEIAKGYAGKLTYREKQAIMNKWGLDPENYAYVKLVEEQANDLANSLFTQGSEEYYTEQLAKAAETNSGLMDLMQKAGEEGSMMSQMQVTGSLILDLKNAILNLSHGVKQTGAAWASEEAKNKVAEEAKKERDALDRERERKNYMEATGHVPEWL